MTFGEDALRFCSIRRIAATSGGLGKVSFPILKMLVALALDTLRVPSFLVRSQFHVTTVGTSFALAFQEDLGASYTVHGIHGV